MEDGSCLVMQRGRILNLDITLPLTEYVQNRENCIRWSINPHHKDFMMSSSRILWE